MLHKTGVSDYVERSARSTLAHERGFRVRSVPPHHCPHRRHGRVISRMGSYRFECSCILESTSRGCRLTPSTSSMRISISRRESRLSGSIAIVGRRPDRPSALTTQSYFALPGKVALMMRICTDQLVGSLVANRGEVHPQALLGTLEE